MSPTPPALAKPIQHVLTQWPMLGKLWPMKGFLGGLSKENLVYLVSAAILPRIAIGGLRIAADTPALNPNPVPEKDKARTFLERIFVELFGTIGGFVVMLGGQDAVANLVEVADKKLHPSLALEQLKAHLDSGELKTVETALSELFKAPKLAEAKGLAHKVLFEGATAGNFEKKIGSDLYKKALPVMGPFFAHLSTRTNVAMLGGLLANTLFAGFLWQDLNDTVFRKRAIPFLLEKIFHYSSEDAQHSSTEEQPAFVAPSAPSTPSLQAPLPTAEFNVIPFGVPTSGLYSPATQPLQAAPAASLNLQSPSPVAPNLTPSPWSQPNPAPAQLFPLNTRSPYPVVFPASGLSVRGAS